MVNTKDKSFHWTTYSYWFMYIFICVLMCVYVCVDMCVYVCYRQVSCVLTVADPDAHRVCSGSECSTIVLEQLAATAVLYVGLSCV